MEIEEREALIRAHESNIARLYRLLATDFTELERRYIHKRVAEERSALNRLLRSERNAGTAARPRLVVIANQDRPEQGTKR